MSRFAGFDLNKLIKDRKVEKHQLLRARLEQGRQVISERRQIGGKIKPFPKGSFEILKRIGIWETTLGYIDDSSDLSSAYFACPTFHGILNERRKLTLLPEALRILNDEGYNKRFDEERVVEKMNFLSLRRVSNAWKKVVEAEYFEGCFSGPGSWYTELTCRPIDEVRYDVCTFKSEECVDRAIEVFSNCVDNTSFRPLIRKLYVDTDVSDSDSDIETFFRKVCNFLSLYGESVWLCEFNGREFLGSLSACQVLWRMVQEMPNLKALALWGVTKPFREMDVDEAVVLIEWMTENPFPVVDSLEYIHFREENTLLLLQIYMHCLNLKSISHEFNQNVSVDMVKHFRKMRLERYVERDQDPDDDGRYRILHHPTVVMSNVVKTWPLKKLQIHVRTGLVKASVLFPVLNRLQGTLTHLEIRSSVILDKTNVSLVLPHLKHLFLSKIARDRGTICLDDLLQLKSLEKLSICLYEDETHGEGTALVEVAGIKRNMEHSQIWDVFPYLTILEFHSEDLRYVKRGFTLTLYELQTGKKKRDCKIVSAYSNKSKPKVVYYLLSLF